MSDTRDQPEEDGSREVAPREAKLAGIVQQIAADIVVWDETGPEHILRQRLTESGIPFEEAEIAPLVDRIRLSVRVDREPRD